MKRFWFPRVGSFGSLRREKSVRTKRTMRTKSPLSARDCSVYQIKVRDSPDFLPRTLKAARAVVSSAVQEIGAGKCCGAKLSRLPTIKRTHSPYPCSLRDICSLCGPREAKQYRAEVSQSCLTNSVREMTRSLRRKNSEPGLSVSWLRRHGTSGSVQSRTGPLRRYGPGIRIVTAVARFSGRVQRRSGFCFALWACAILTNGNQACGYFVSPKLRLPETSVPPIFRIRALRRAAYRGCQGWCH
jgi:hypothetical protein